MASGQTTNYNLNQWEAGDHVLRTEFNEDNAKIDGALGTIPKIAIGAYVGDGSATRKIPLDFTPKVVYVCMESGLAYNPSGSGYLYGGLAVTGNPAWLDVNGKKYYGVGISTNSFYVYEELIDSYSAIHSNLNGKGYRYLAIG